jgi:hypothetical protein
VGIWDANKSPTRQRAEQKRRFPPMNNNAAVDPLPLGVSRVKLNAVANQSEAVSISIQGRGWLDHRRLPTQASTATHSLCLSHARGSCGTKHEPMLSCSIN